MDRTVQDPDNTGKPAWYAEYVRLREMGVKVRRICQEIGVPKSTLYLALQKIQSEREDGAA